MENTAFTLLGLNYLGKSTLTLLFAAGISTAAMAADLQPTALEQAKDAAPAVQQPVAGESVKVEAPSSDNIKIAKKDLKSKIQGTKKEEGKVENTTIMPSTEPAVVPVVPATK